MTSSTPTPPAAWHPDPSRRFDLRYWDGSKWTEHVAKDGVQSIDALVPEPAVKTDSQINADRSTAGKHAGDIATAPGPSLFGRLRAKRKAVVATKVTTRSLRAESTFKPRRPSRVKPRPQKSKQYAPCQPDGSAYAAWGPNTSRLEVAGESYYGTSYRKIFQGIRIDDYSGAELHLLATLIADPANPYDRNAVAVFLKGLHAGYLAADDAKQYSQSLLDLQSNGRNLEVEARAWCSTANGHTSARTSLKMPPPNGIAPRNPLPSEPNVVLPTGSVIQVVKENEYMEALVPLLEDDAETFLAATLRVIHDIRPRSALETVEISINGNPVGMLSATQAANMLPVVKFFRERSLIPVVRATLRGNALKADVILYVAKSQDIDQDWLNSFGKVTPSVVDAPTRPAFEWDDADTSSE